MRKRIFDRKQLLTKSHKSYISLELNYPEESSFWHPALQILHYKILGDQETISNKSMYLKTLKKKKVASESRY